MNYRSFIKEIICKLPYISRLKKKVDLYESNLMVLPGHFYSPIINAEEILLNEKRIFDINKSLDGIELNRDAQFELLKNFLEYYQELPFTRAEVVGNRYFYDNNAYSYSDAIFLYSMIRNCKPKRIIEIGSGFSSAVMLDVNELFFNHSIDLTFIEPFPTVLKQRVKTSDKFTLLEKKVQDVDIEIFKSLQENDILFIDSTHVAKTNSDVLFEILQILPHLNKGVKIHIHDIFFPFEYPKDWVIEYKRNWNEIYFVQAFLMYNTTFKIVAFNTYLAHAHRSWFEDNMPLCLENTGGSLWLEKVE